jgi:hypothetical protein
VPDPHDATSDGNCRAPSARAGSAALWIVVLLAVLAGVLGVLAVQSRFHTELRGHVQSRLAEMFPDARVRIGSVSTKGTEGILAHDVELFVREGTKARRAVVIDVVTLGGDLDLSHWVQQTIRIRSVALHKPRFDLWRTSAGTWSLQQLRCVTRGDSPAPEVTVHHGQLRVFRSADDAFPLVCHDVEGRLTPTEQPALDGAGFPLAHSHRVLAAKLTARGNGIFEALELEGRIEPDTCAWSLTGSIEQLHYTPDLIAKLPPPFQDYVSQIAGLSCKAGATLTAKSAPAGGAPYFEARGRIHQGRLQDPRLPYPLENLSGQFFCNAELLQLRDVKATSGDARFELNTDVFGLKPDAPMNVVARAEQLQLDARLYNALPRQWQQYWDQLRLSGTVDAHVRLDSNGQQWSPTVTVNCHDVGMECWLFPYPVSQVRGQIHYQDEQLSCEKIRGQASGQPVVGSFRFQKLAQQWYGKLELSVLGTLAIDEKLIHALTVRGQPKSNTEKFVRSLDPRGSFILHHAVLERRTEDSGLWHKDLNIQIVDSSLVYGQFSYPLYDIRGRIRAEDDTWRLEGFEGRNDSGRILCHGGWSSRPGSNIPFELNFLAYDLPMEEELRRALPPDARQLWEEIQPSGSLDRAEVRIARAEGQETLDIEVTLHEENNSNALTGQSLRLHPRSFPYWLSDVACDIIYRPGSLQILQASASNGNSRVAVQANCWRTAVDGTWAGVVKWLPHSRVLIDTQLLRALPESVSEGLVALDLRGPVSVIGESRFELPRDPAASMATQFDLRLNLEDVQFGDGKDVDGIRGEVALRGARDTSQLQALGVVSIDAMSVRGVPVTQLIGPIALSGNEFFFGAATAGRIPAGSTIEPTPMSADALSGKLSISGQGQLDSGRIAISAQLENADLRLMMQDLGANQVPTDATCQAAISFSGIPANPQTYSGSGKIHLSDAELYRLPTMMRLMRMLSVNPADNVAFHTADINFQIDGDRIPLQLACEGDVLSLRGGGWTNLRRELDLELYSYVGRRVPLSSVLTPLLPESRYATFMLVQVTGTLDNPHLERKAFPQLEAMQQQIFPDKATATAAPRALFSGLRQVTDSTTEGLRSTFSATTPNAK